MREPIDTPGTTPRTPNVDPLGRVPVRLRIGVVGHRWLTEDESTVSAVHEAVADIRASCSIASTEHTTVGLTVLTALAEGADRLVADAGISLGAQLEVILPLPPADYERDFTSEGSRLRFRALLASASHVAVVGSLGQGDEAYFEAGRRIVDRCDVLLAVWDGLPARGVGGTAQVIAYADQRAIPVRWLQAHPETGIVGIRPRPDHQDSRIVSPLSPRSFRSLDFFNSRSIRLDPGSRTIALTDASVPLEPYFARADQIATRYQKWLLRSSRAIYTLAVVAVATVATQLVFLEALEDADWLPWIEVVALSAIGAVLVLGRGRSLLRRWLSARQLAERLRVAAVLRSAGFPAPPAWGRVLENDDWVDRSMDELWTLADTGATAPALPDLKRILIGGWLEEQIQYHERTRARAAARQRVAVPITIGLFGISLVAALGHALGWLGTGVGHSWSLISIVAPTAAAAVSGYVGQREYVRRARRSRQAAEALTRTQHEIANAADHGELHRILDRLQPELAGEAQDWSTTTTIHDLDVP